MILNKRFFLTFFSSISAISLLSVFVSSRDLIIGIDTLNYIDNFLKLTQCDCVDLKYFEPGFQIITYVISIFTSDITVYLYILSFLYLVLFNWFVFSFFLRYNTTKDSNVIIFLLLCFSLLFLSNFFYSGAINGIRQGLAAPLVFLFSLSFFNRKFLSAFFFAIFAVSFHYSSVIYLFSVVCVFFIRRHVLSIFLISAALYSISITESIIKYFSELLGLPLYHFVKNYSDTGLYEGFNVLFFLYTLIPVLFVVYFMLFDKEKKENEGIKFLLFGYVSFSLPYFWLGFGGYANRYAFTAWLFLPIYSSFFVFLCLKRNCFFLLLSLLIFIISVLYFVVKLKPF